VWRKQTGFSSIIYHEGIIIPPQYANLLTGLPTVETLIRALYGGYQFNHEHGGSFTYANITDVPSYTGSYPSILAAGGSFDVQCS
jgi:hypothetical protein